MSSLSAAIAGSEDHPQRYAIEWTSPREIVNGPATVGRILIFRGSALSEEYGMLPVFMKSLPFDPEKDAPAGCRILDPVVETLPEPDLELVKGLDRIPPDFEISVTAEMARRETFLRVKLLPLRRNSSTGLVERLVSFGLEISTIPAQQNPLMRSGVAYAPHSVLSSGTWYKFGVAANAIYRLTYDDLKNAGIDVASVNPNNLRIYGNGGGMLPEANSAYRIDDLMENAVYVYGAEDNRFDPGDFVLFYGQGPDQWEYNKTSGLFHCRKNIYSDRMYYFLNFDIGAGRRIRTEVPPTGTITYHATKFNDYAVYEKDDVNLIKSGREWWDKQYFDVTTLRSYPFSFPNIDVQSPVTVSAFVAARSIASNSSFVVAAQGTNLMSLDIRGISGGFEDDYAIAKTGTASFLPSSPSIDISLTYRKGSSSSVGYLNYIELNAKRALTMSGPQMAFRSAEGTAAGAVTEFTLNGNGQSLQIWDVTHGDDIRRIDASLSGGNYTFRSGTDTLREFIAFDGTGYGVPEFAGMAGNQDLHGTEPADYIMVCNTLFLNEAERLADFHRKNSGLTVLIVTPEQIYNEFSSGAQDITAIRDFVRMMYNMAEAGREPAYLLLFGDASYDFKNRTQNNTNFVPSFESVESLSPVSSFVSDDYFGLLDPGEGASANGSLDIGVGRLPVDSPEQAAAAVDKVIYYCSQHERVKNDWRNVVTFVADDQNEGGNLFINDSEDLAGIIDSNYRSYNVDKIYSDAYAMVSTPGGARYPEVNEAINQRVGKGALIMNYVGHGGEVGWAHERILEVPDIKAWTNFNSMPVFVTATCEFSRFDDPGRVSAGEWVFLNEHGGGIALFTTTRLTFAGTNKSLLVNFYEHVFDQSGGAYMKMGDLLRVAKSGMGSSPNIHAFVLLGDPAMQMSYPSLNVVTTSINARPPSAIPDTLKALSEITITGEVRDLQGQKAEDFSGTLFPTVFDKASEVWTRANQGPGDPVQFFLRKNAVYKGKIEVTNGSFSFSFIVPKDIAYQYGVGKISYYARSPLTDASGFDERIQVGGYDSSAEPDDDGPVIALFMNDRNFRSGGITGPDPVLLVDVSDSSGINAVGNGIGHDITAVLDDATTYPMILNDYYVSDLNTFKSGEISFPLSSLAEGEHHITVKVWDVHNNSAEASIAFVVVSADEFALTHLLNYPNPMKDQTTFTWETNQAGQTMEAEIRIYTLNGSPVKTIRQSFYGEGYRTAFIRWDGTQDDGRKVCSGLYVYSLWLTLSDGTSKQQSSKLVVIR